MLGKHAHMTALERSDACAACLHMLDTFEAVVIPS